jgi:hypothetical protein
MHIYTFVTFVSFYYTMDSPGIESLWGEIFHPVQTGPGAHPTSCTMGTGSFQEVKRPGRGADHQPPSSAEVKKEYSHSFNPPLGLQGFF